MGSKSFIFTFDDVEVREREFTVLKAGVAQAVEPKAFRVLLVLLKSPQKLVAKEELMKAVWGDAAVTDNSLTRSVATLRKALADDAHQPRYIETVTTVGYRFLLPVRAEQEISAGSEAGGTEAPLIKDRRLKDRRRAIPGRWIGATGVAVAALAGAGWWLGQAAAAAADFSLHAAYPRRRSERSQRNGRKQGLLHIRRKRDGSNRRGCRVGR